jgi:hypothetical protein
MEIVLQRNIYTNDSTIGELTFGDKKVFTLEDKVRDINKDGDLDDKGEAKVYGETAIPCGTYQIVITYSNRFKKPLPLLMNVKGFEGIRIHPGNTKADTHGCILLGLNKQSNMITESRSAMSIFMSWLSKTSKKDKIYIKIIDKK